MKLSNLFESTPDLDKKREEIMRWIQRWPSLITSGKLTVDQQGSELVINCTNSVTLRNDQLDEDDNGCLYIPHKFGEIGGNFKLVVAHEKLASLKNGPERVEGKYNIASTAIQSLDGAPGYIGGTFDLTWNRKIVNWEGFPGNIGELRVSETGITSFKGISGPIARCGKLQFDPKTITSGVLELLKIDYLDCVEVYTIGSYTKEETEEYAKLERIINTHIGENYTGDVLDLQSDLIDEGLISWAKN